MSDTAQLEQKLVDFTFGVKASTLNIDLKFEKDLNAVSLDAGDSLLLIGKASNLKKVQHSLIAKQLKELNVPESWFESSVKYLCPEKPNKSKTEETNNNNKQANGTSISWLNKFIIQTLSSKCSRNNTPSRANLITKIIRQNSYSDKQLIVIACERKYSIACAAAVARTFPLYTRKTTKNATGKQRNVLVAFVYTDEAEKSQPTSEDVKCFDVLAKSIRLTSRIVDTPCAEMTTDHFLDEIIAIGKELGLKPLVIEGEELNKQGFGGLYNVGKAAINPPKLVVLSHLKPQSTKTIAWVGKGIVYDTGGLCIKSKAGMCTMKEDCGGAAGILGAFYTAVSLGFEDNLHAVFCLAENAVGPNSYRPDDVIRLYSGKTVEINNTDAEGRLVLGDGVAYAKKDLKADIIVDMATLTGAQVGATGKYHAAVLTNNEKWEKQCVEVGKTSGDLCFPIIFAPELHFDYYKSEVADMTNSTGKTDSGSSCAGLFIYSHLGADFDGIWIHLDIAAPVSDDNRATGYGVTLLNALFASSIKDSTFSLVGTNADLPLKTETETED